MGPRQTLKLQLYSSGSLPVPVSPEKLACSPVLDLVATGDNDSAFFIRRANGEQVSKPAQIPGAQILAIRWKPDGVCLFTSFFLLEAMHLPGASARQWLTAHSPTRPVCGCSLE